jgi:hypothetical protein
MVSRGITAYTPEPNATVRSPSRSATSTTRHADSNRSRIPVLHEGDEPNAVADLRDADVLPRKGVTEIHLPSLETNPPTVSAESVTYVSGPE